MKYSLMGNRTNKIDAKGRISIPANMRGELGTEFVASRGTGKCLALYPLDEWDEFMESIEKVNHKKRKQLKLFFLSSAERMSLDGQGRLLLNEELRKSVDLLGESEAVVFGNGTKVEIWNCRQFAQEVGGISVEEVEDILDEFDI
ncbi:MAG: division/cell wall cluster transcriptional repressor MraZ [Ruminococcaceae bacterium]|nr:division/cell wall cluster transcriptional repressor MraZ [Oscillospiraceae bacterium]